MFMFGYGLGEIPGEVARFMGFLWHNYLGLGAVIGVSGFTLFWKRDKNLLISLLIIIGENVMFFANYHVSDKDTMFLLAFLVWALLISWGMLWESERSRQLTTMGILHSRARVVVPVMFILIPIMAVVINWAWVD